MFKTIDWKLKFMIVSILMSSVFFITGCSKGKGDETCQQCKPLPPDRQLNIKIGTIEKSFNLYKNDGRNNKNNYYVIDARSTYSPMELATTLKTLNFDRMVNISLESLVGIAYLVDKDLSKKPAYQVNNNDIKGLVVYFLKGGKLNAEVLINDMGTFGIIDNLSAETDWISYNDLETLSQHFFNNGTHAISMILISDFSKTGEERRGKNQFGKNLNQYTRITAVHKPTGGFDHLEHPSCGSPCPRPGKLGCSKRAGTPTCDDLATDCAKTNLSPWNTYSEGQDPRNPILHSFKDNIMAHSEIGQHFINDFYYIGGFLKDKLNAQIAAESFTIMDNRVIPIVNKLLNNPQSTEMIYGNEAKDELLIYVSHVRALSDDPIFQEMMDEIKENIEYASGKTVKDTYTEIMAN